MSILRNNIGVFIVLAVLAPLQGFSAGTDVVDRVEKPVQKAVEIRQHSQRATSQWQEERRQLVEEYEQLQETRTQLEKQKAGLEQSLAATTGRIEEKQKQLADIEQISTQIQPFLVELLDRLKREVKEDMPFLGEERYARLHRLDHMVADPDVAMSEQFRKIMEALMVEADYGRTIEVYQETIEVENQKVLANIFRLGRLALFYQTLDQDRCGFFNVASGLWETLPKSYDYAIQTGMDIGAKRRPVELLRLPIGRMVVK